MAGLSMQLDCVLLYLYVNLSLSNVDQLNLLIFGNFSDLFLKSRLCPKIMLLNMALTQGIN